MKTLENQVVCILPIDQSFSALNHITTHGLSTIIDSRARNWPRYNPFVRMNSHDCDKICTYGDQGILNCYHKALAERIKEIPQVGPFSARKSTIVLRLT